MPNKVDSVVLRMCLVDIDPIAGKGSEIPKPSCSKRLATTGACFAFNEKLRVWRGEFKESVDVSRVNRRDERLCEFQTFHFVLPDEPGDQLPPGQESWNHYTRSTPGGPSAWPTT